MPKTKISEYSATANSNTDVASINIDEGCAPSGINNAIRAVMGHLKDFQSGTSNDPFTVGSSGSLTLSYGTANGVAYLNGSKVLTTGSALTFDGTNLGLGGTNNSYGSQTAMTLSGTNVSRIDFRSNSTFTGTILSYQAVTEGLRLQTEAGYPITFYPAGTKAATIDTAGNLGLGVTPSAWNTVTGFQVGRASLYGYAANEAGFQNNAFYSTVAPSGWKYIANGFSSQIQLDSSGNLAFKTAPSGTAGNAITFTQAMTLDASGNLGIGTTGQTSRISATGSSSTDFYALTLRNSSGTTSSTAVLTFEASSGTQGDAASSVAYIKGIRTGAGTTGDLAFWTTNAGTPAERARIDSSGNLLVGTTSNASSRRLLVESSTTSGYPFEFKNTASSGTPYGLVISYSGTAPNGTGSSFLYLADNAALRLEVRSNGGIANYSANNVNLSDRREKTNFAPAKSYLDVICAIPVQTFNYIDQNLEDDAGLTLGVVAQDVQAVAPELVMESNWGTEEEPKMRLSIYQTDLQYALMKALQELKAEFDAYKASHP